MIYTTALGYVRELATFKEYRSLQWGKVTHETPVFDFQDKEITGLECFWLLPENAANDDHLLFAQKQLIPLQVKVLELAHELGYDIPQKIKDREINKMAKENIDRMKKVIETFGFDPRDETWIEIELAENEREKKWFQFERENGLSFTDQWEHITKVFNSQFDDNLSVEQAKNLSKKRTRYYLGAFDVRMSGNGNIQDWVSSARKFEEVHRNRENRMLSWSLKRVKEFQGRFPLVKVLKPIRFWPGPYFHQFLEKAPHLFDGVKSMNVKVGTVLRVISYDPVDRYIRLDVTEDIRKLIKPDETENANIWIKEKADYDFWLKKEQIDTHLEILEPLEVVPKISNNRLLELSKKNSPPQKWFDEDMSGLFEEEKNK